MTIDTVFERRVEMATVRLDETSLDLVVAVLLRAFDEARRRVSERVTGAEGLGVGYDHLDVDPAALRQLLPGATVTITAMITAEWPRRHRVEYTATAALVGPNGSRRSALLVSAHGWTLAPYACHRDERQI